MVSLTKSNKNNKNKKNYTYGTLDFVISIVQMEKQTERDKKKRT